MLLIAIAHNHIIKFTIVIIEAKPPRISLNCFGFTVLSSVGAGKPIKPAIRIVTIGAPNIIAEAFTRSLIQNNVPIIARLKSVNSVMTPILNGSILLVGKLETLSKIAP